MLLDVKKNPCHKIKSSSSGLCLTKFFIIWLSSATINSLMTPWARHSGLLELQRQDPIEHLVEFCWQRNKTCEEIMTNQTYYQSGLIMISCLCVLCWIMTYLPPDMPIHWCEIPVLVCWAYSGDRELCEIVPVDGMVFGIRSGGKCVLQSHT